MKPVYLDYASATPLDESVLSAMLPYFGEKFYNPSALYSPAREIKSELEASRSKIADILGVKNNEIIFIAGATESNNLAIKGILNKFADSNYIVSAVEHPAVLEVAVDRQKRIGVDKFGVINLQDLSSAVDDQTSLISVMYANNEIGTIQPLAEIANIVADVNRDRKSRGVDLPLFFHSDCSQATNYLNMKLKKLGLHLATISSGKIYGPKQVSALYIASGINIDAEIVGGGQEFGLRSGTENIAGIIGFGQALQLTTEMANSEGRRLTELRQQLIKGLSEIRSTIIVNGHPKKTLPNIINFLIPGVDNERLVYQLEQKGFLIATGSACSASKQEASHVLTAIGLSREEAGSSLRLSMGRSTTQNNISDFLTALKSLLPPSR